MDFLNMRLRHADEALARWRDAALPVRPVSGWVRTIRDALGMSSAALAQRLQLTGSAVRKLEESEAADAITLGSLRRLAAALDCELQYALVPRQPLAAARRQQAVRLARQQVAVVASTMALEDQAVAEALTHEHIQQVVEKLLAKRSKGFW